MKTINTLLFLLISVIAWGQESKSLTAEQIIDSSLAFCGGEIRIAKMESSEATYLLVQPDNSTAIISEKRKTGKKYVQSVLSKTHFPQTTFFDGKKLTRVDSSSVLHLKDMHSVEEIKLKTYDHIQYGYKVLNYEMTRLQDQKFKNFDCYVINSKASNGYVTLNFFDKTNFRLLMVVYPNGNKSLMIEYLFKDGLLFNSHIVNTFAKSEELQVLKLHNIELNTNISDLWFNCPYEDKVYIPAHIITGKFESTNGVKTVFTRTANSQDYHDDKGKITMRRFLKWANNDAFGLIEEKDIKDNVTSPESEILVRIISWDKRGYVCHWVAGKYTDTQDYKLIQ